MKSSRPPCFGGCGFRALVADDDDDARALLATCLRRAGFDVAEACDGRELLELFALLRAAGPEPLIVVSDIGMPGCDGLEAMRLLRGEDPELPVVLVTAFSDSVTLRAAEDAGAAVVLSKPVDSGTLVRAVVQLASERTAATAAAAAMGE